MDTEKVIAFGLVIHQLLGFIGGGILCYFGYRLLMKRVKGRQREWHWDWMSAKSLIRSVAPGVLFSLSGALAIWLTAANRFVPKVIALKKEVPALAPKPLPSAALPSLTPAGDDERLVMSLQATGPEMKLANREMVPKNDSRVDPLPGPAVSPAPMISSKPNPSPSPLGSPTPVSAPKEPSGVDRKVLEKERREAERKRARLEERYQKHLISSEAYKKGEEEYKSAILKYRSQMNGVGYIAPD
jgi:hypothetical protein